MKEGGREEGLVGAVKLLPKIEEKAWSPSLEAEVLKKWEGEAEPFNPQSRREVFVLDTPPPYPSGRPWHIGAAAHYSQIDMIARTAAMSGYEVLFPIGIDRNGLPVELYTEKKYHVKAHLMPRERFIELCRQALDDLEREMIQIMKRMGLSGDFNLYYRTDSEEYRQLTQATFIELWRRGLIYRASRPNNYCTDCQTTIADAEVEYEELPTQLVYILFRVKEAAEHLVVATTRPELLSSCQIVLVNPEDERYKRLHGLHVYTPIFGREVEIRPHPSVRPEFGTGVVMVCSYGDYTDVLLFRELGLKEVISIDTEGRMTGEAARYRGLEVRGARVKIVADLEREGLVERKEPIVHRTPMCSRSRTPIEIILMDEYYLKQLPFKEDVRTAAEEMVFHPEAHRHILLDWIESVSLDWPISRRRYYATEIPVWYCNGCGEPHVPEPGRYYRPWRDEAPFDRCVKCGGREFVGDERTFDTWMDSSITPLFITRYMRDNGFFERTYPTSLRPQAKDIVRTWLYYTILRCYQLTGRTPFRHAWIMGYGVDEKGERMSKSKGNVVDPIPILEAHGGDSFRFWSASEASLGSDFRCSEARIAGSKKFLTKLWNIARFISSFPQPSRAELTAADRWILAELSNLVNECMEGYRDFNFFIPSNRVREFTWNLFAAHYIEMIKARAYGSGFSEVEQTAVWYALHTCLKTILLLLAPIMPFITDSIWRRLYGEGGIHRQRFPEAEWGTEASRYTVRLIEFNSKVWNEKKAMGLSLKDPIKAEVPAELEELSRDLKVMHNIQS